MTDKSTYRSTLRRHSVSESDTDPLNSTANPQGKEGFAIVSACTDTWKDTMI